MKRSRKESGRVWKSLLVVVLALGSILAGCSSGEKNSDRQEAGAQPSASAQPSAGAQPGDAANTGKYDPLIELTTVSMTSTLVKYDSGDDINNNAWTRYLEETYGIKVKRKWSTTSDGEFEQKTNLMIASNELPDFFQVTPMQFAQLQEADLLADLTQAYESAPAIIRQLMDEAGPEVLESARTDGKLFALPWTGIERELVPMVWIRKDWMSKLNLPEPQTMDDLLAISSAFAKQDPDGNGKDDTYGIMIDKDFYYIKGLLNGFHAYNDIWIQDESGKLVYSNIQPEMKTALGKLQQIFEDGQLDPEFAVKDVVKAVETIASNKVGIFFSDWGGANYPASTSLPDVEWQAYAVPTPDGQLAKLQHNLNINGAYWVVRKGVANPEALFKMAEAFVQYFYLTTDKDEYEQLILPATKDVNPVWMIAPVKIYRSLNNLQAYRDVSAAINGEKDISQLTVQQRTQYDRYMKYKDGDQSFWWQEATTGANGSGKILEAYIKNDQFMPNRFTGNPTPAMISKNANLSATMNEVFTKIIMGQSSLDEFDTFVTSWKKLGGDEITEEVNAWFAGRK